MSGFREAGSALRFLREQVRKALVMVERLQDLPIWLMDEVCRRKEDAVAEAIRAQLAATCLRELGVGDACSLLEREGIRSVQQVLDTPMRDMLRIQGLGPASAANIKALAELHREEVRAKVRELPDPDHRRVGDTPLLQSLVAYGNFRRKVEPELAGLQEEGDRLASAANEVVGRHGVVARAFSKRRRQSAIQESASVAREVMQLGRRLEESLKMGDPTQVDPRSAWSLYESNAAPFAAALEHSTAQRDRSRAVRPRQAKARRLGGGSGSKQESRRGSGSAKTGDLHPQMQRLPPVDPKQTGGLPSELVERIEASKLLRGPLTASLRRYQEFGARFLAHQGRAILGDDMGLGKTVQVLAYMCHLHALGARRFLVVAPNSLLINWEREVMKHSHLRPMLLHGSTRNQLAGEWSRKGGVAITTYGTLGALSRSLIGVDLLVADEAHYAKNPSSKRSQALGAIAGRASRVALLTGTAIENRLEEMGNLVRLVSQDVPGLVKVLVGKEEPDPLHVRSQLAPFYLRRSQGDVLKELPERSEVYEWVEFTKKDLEAYRCAEATGDLMTVRHAASAGCGTSESAKIQRLGELFEEYRSGGRKVVVFSYFRQTLDLVAGMAKGCEQIHGGLAAAERQAVIDRFSQQEGFAVLASQVEAGGLGLNIQAAQVVVLMEPQLKPSTESQAIARVHRMGQSRVVTVHRLVAKASIEEWAIELLETKRKIFNNYADPSALKDLSAMAVDPTNCSIEQELADRWSKQMMRRTSMSGAASMEDAR